MHPELAAMPENIPLVLIDYRIPDLKIDTVFMDNRAGLFFAIKPVS